MNKLESIPNLSKVNQVKSKPIPEKELSEKTNLQSQNREKKDHNVTLSQKSKVLAQELVTKKIEQKVNSFKDEPAVFFISGFDWFGAGSIKGNYDGIQDMSDSLDDAQKFAWDEKKEMLKEIKKRNNSAPLILVGHSFGADTAVEIANELNTLENGFRGVDLLVTLDSVGFNNDIIPQNVKKNLNFLAQGPYEFINDGPNIARSFERTDVQNFLTEKLHADLDDSKDIQIEIMDAISNIV